MTLPKKQSKQATDEIPTVPSPGENGDSSAEIEVDHWLSVFTGRWMMGIGVALFALSLFLQILLHFHQTRTEMNPPGPPSSPASQIQTSEKTAAREFPPPASTGNRRSFVAMSPEIFLEWAFSFMRELGAVLVVSYLIRELIEKGQQKVWQNALSKRVDNILIPAVNQVRELNVDLGITLRNSLIFDNEDARKELTRKVLRPDFIRRNYVLTLTLEGNPGDKHVKVTTDTNYILENVANAARTYSIRGWIDTAQDAWLEKDQQSKFTFLAFGPAELREQDSHRPIEATQLSDPKIVKRSELTLELEYPIKPDIPVKGKYFSRLTAVQYMRCQEQFIWNMAYVTDRLDVVVELRGNLTWKNFAVSPRPMHHQDKFDREPAAIALSDQEARTWTIAGVLLPNQGVQVWWSPKPETSSVDQLLR
jgi:hypothetical protein